MAINHIIQRSIDRQFLKNNRKNFFYTKTTSGNHFFPDTRYEIEMHRNELLKLDEFQSRHWIDQMTERALRTFCLSNQFLDLRESQIIDLHRIYELLWADLVSELRKSMIDFELLEQKHLSRLTQWLLSSNPFVKELNSSELPEIVEVVCAEYSAGLQMTLLQIDLCSILEPVLDVGCGEQANLVKYLRQLGINSYGNDRLADTSLPFLFRSNWLEFDYQPKQWGTIIANQSFSLHFLNHNQRSDGNYLAYARKYMEILNSLKPGGTFYYAPSLPFIESFLPSEKFHIINHQINETSYGTKITREI